ncbi:MAG: DEAD/DEAH box helicase [Deltaproteobacteria bacterium]|nr:DEAD/DEAH box helicase [Deltaproteobacteria bacterium]
MAQLDALRLADALRQRLVDFAVDDSFVRDARLADICRQLWAGPPEKGGLLSDLWVEGAFPAAEAKWSLEDLVQRGEFDGDLCAQLDKPEAMPRRRRLYTHQYEALVCAREVGPRGERPAIVVTAGTGTGKTEAFLLPILNDLYTRDDDGVTGTKCIILYPMNALVNDQVDRLYNWLHDQTRVTLFHFTSETPEDKHRADRQGVPVWDACRMCTRQEARGLETRDVDPRQRVRTPDIIITNYSMLEYMLCRPQDAVFFGSALRAIVLDEAHLYTGTLAAEITLLMRRLLIRCGVSSNDVLQMATSATLGTGSQDELRKFAATLFTKEAQFVHMIQGQSTRTPMAPPAQPAKAPTASVLANRSWLERPLLVADDEGMLTLAYDSGLCERLREQLPLLVAADTVRAVDPQEQRPAVLLHATLAASPLIHRLEDRLWERKRLPLRELAVTLWDESSDETIQATILLLQLAASARCQPTDYPLVPHRIHLMARPSDGLVVCLDDNCSGDPNRRLIPLGTVSAGVQDSCPACGSAVLSLFRCTNCGEWMLAGVEDGNYVRPVPPWALPDVLYSTLDQPSAGQVVIAPATGERSGAGASGQGVSRIFDCPNCGSERVDLRPFASSVPLTLTILAETVLAELPEFPSTSNLWLPARGRRMLAFSDSRQEAARLGPRLTRQHETQLLRSAIVNSLSQNLAADEETVAMVRRMLGQVEEQLARPGLTPAQRQFLEQQVRQYQQQLSAFTAGGSIDTWAEALSRQEILAEVLDVETAIGHSTVQWSQQVWERNRERVRQRARIFLAREFASPIRRANSAETFGLAEVTYPGLDTVEAPRELLGKLPNEEARQRLRSYWSALLHALCDTLRTDRAITLGSDEEDNAYPLGGVSLGAWCAEREERGSLLVRFVGETVRQRRRWFATAVLRTCRLPEKDAEQGAPELLRAAFRQLLDRAVPVGRNPESGSFPWLQRSERQTRQGPPADALRLVFAELGLQRPAELFQCERTGHVWCRSVLGCAPEFGCVGTLKQVTEKELDRDPRIGRQRREYRESLVFQIGLWAEEHSAQLSPKETRRLQDLFKAGIRNILSATTTLELGIDIGGLNAVLMSNVPPGKANYLQRAGRAGRRADGSSVVITFARSRPFDREVFQRIGDYLDRPLRRPLVFLDRDRVVRRHFHSFLLGQFFQAIYPSDLRVGAMRAFGDMGDFCGVPLPPYWRRDERKPVVLQATTLQPGDAAALPWWNPASQSPGLETQYLSYLYWVRDQGGSELRPTAEILFRDTAMTDQVTDWSAFLQAVIDDFMEAVQSWRSDYNNLLQAWQAADKRPQANAIRYQLSALYELTVIEALADRQFLPHYGFPIGVHKLRVIAPDEERGGKIREEDQYRLDRGSLLALREYVPGSQLLVGGKLVSSRGVLKHWTGANLDTYVGLRGRYCRCTNSHFYYWLSEDPGKCPICSAPPRENPADLLFPKYGFSGAAWDPPKWSTDVERIGSAEAATITFTQQPRSGSVSLAVTDFGGVTGLTARYREDGELLVYNRGEYERGFAICLNCGYAESEQHFGQGAVQMPSGFNSHAPLTATSRWAATCWRGDDAPVLRNQVLAARETTDVLLLDFSRCLSRYAIHGPLVTTLAYALQRAGAQLLELDARELGVLVVPAGDGGQGLGAVLYDSVAGGAGHVRELLALGRGWLTETRKTLFVSDAHHTRCKTACLDCLLSFDAQDVMARNLFDRRFAIAVLDALLENSPLPTTGQATVPSPRNSTPTLPLDVVGTGGRSKSERLEQARTRLQRRRT